VTVGAQVPQVLSAIVEVVPVDVIDFKRQLLAVPGTDATETRASLLTQHATPSLGNRQIVERCRRIEGFTSNSHRVHRS
jgi:hypothetical protein